MQPKLRTLCTALLFAGMAIAQTSGKPETMNLWPGTAPGEKGDIGEEKDMTTAKDNLVGGKAVIRTGNISVPTLTIYRPARPNGTAVLVFPGGGYRILAWDLEGTEICEWLNGIGVTCGLVKYRVPSREGMPRYAASLQDAQRAIGLVRHNADKWGVDAARIGVLGFSAGAHLSAAAGNNFAKRTYDAIDAADQVPCRPDFMVLVYPGYLTLREDITKVSPELAPSAQTPPTFIVQAQDDFVPVEGALHYYAALKAAKVPAEMHLYAKGGHGYGLRPSTNPISAWPKRVEEWFRAGGLLNPRK